MCAQNDSYIIKPAAMHLHVHIFLSVLSIALFPDRSTCLCRKVMTELFLQFSAISNMTVTGCCGNNQKRYCNRKYRMHVQLYADIAESHFM